MTDLELIANAQRSGSLLVKNRETLAVEASLTNAGSGFAFAPQKRETYNIDELKKTIDVNVTELIPEDESTQLDLVPRSIYEDALEALADAIETIETQSETISQLEQTVSQLEAEVDRLNEEVDNEKLLRVLAEENSQTLREELLLATSEIQTSLQRSILEGIEKSSYEAKNEGLIAQVEALKDEVSSLQAEIDQLNSTIQGKDAAIEAGAKAGFDITLLPSPRLKEDGQDILYRVRNNDTDAVWFNGKKVEVYNFTAEPLVVTIKHNGSIEWLKITENASTNLNNVPLILNLAANERKTIELFRSPGAVKGVLPSVDTEYRGTLTFTTKNGVAILTTALQKQVGRRFSETPRIKS